MPLEAFHDPIFMNGPVQDRMAFLRGHQDCQIVMGMSKQLDLMDLHVELPEQLPVLCVVDH